METLFVRLQTFLSIEQWNLLQTILIKKGGLDPYELELINKINSSVEYDMTPEISDPFDDLPM